MKLTLELGTGKSTTAGMHPSSCYMCTVQFFLLDTLCLMCYAVQFILSYDAEWTGDFYWSCNSDSVPLFGNFHTLQLNYSIVNLAVACASSLGLRTGLLDAGNSSRHLNFSSNNPPSLHKISSAPHFPKWWTYLLPPLPSFPLIRPFPVSFLGRSMGSSVCRWDFWWVREYL